MKNQIYPVVTSLFIMLFSQSTSANPLAEYEWEYRPLLVFAESEDDPAYRATVQLIVSMNCQLEERHIIVSRFVNSANSRIAGTEVDRMNENEMRRQFNIADGQFTVILIGKDGGEKYRTTSVPDMKAIFSLVDGMFMRQQEMRLQDSRCG